MSALSDSTLSRFERSFAHLRTGSVPSGWPRELLTRGAPHKPLLLLAVSKLIGKGAVSNAFIPASPELESEFNKLWDIILSKRRTSVAVPFFHLRNDVTDQGEHFWTLVPVRSGEEIGHIRDIRSTAQLRALLSGASINATLFDLLSDVSKRVRLQSVLLDSYFGGSARGTLTRSLE
jgi:putative restriction endonuclease